MTDPIADMLARIRNAAHAGHKRVDMPVSKMKTEVARLLKENHFVQDYKLLDDGRFGVLRIYLKYYDGRPVIRSMQRVSRPGRREYAKAKGLPRVRNGLGMAIISTSQGLLSDKQARERNVGGEVVAVVW
ncbi:MAG: 30S ribosomal protein S8 [Gemmatimonadota bacterium]